MKINVLGTVYDLDSNSVRSARKTVMNFLDIVRNKADLNDIPGYFEIVVIMMYVISSTALRGIPDGNLHRLEIKKNDPEAESPLVNIHP